MRSPSLQVLEQHDLDERRLSRAGRAGDVLVACQRNGHAVAIVGDGADLDLSGLQDLGRRRGQEGVSLPALHAGLGPEVAGELGELLSILLVGVQVEVLDGFLDAVVVPIASRLSPG
jgi:hypothetical protein